MDHGKELRRLGRGVMVYELLTRQLSLMIMSTDSAILHSKLRDSHGSPAFSGYLTLGKLLHLSVTPTLHLKMGIIIAPTS